MKRMEANPKFAKLLRQKEQGRKKLGKIGKVLNGF